MRPEGDRERRRAPPGKRISAVLGLLVLGVVGMLLLLSGDESPRARSADRADLGANVVSDPTDPSQQTDVAFGERSHWLQPWRGYLDTQPASRMRRAPGINFDVPPQEAAVTAQLLADAGVKRARVEIGWSEISPENSGRLKNPDALRTTVGALKRRGIRPLLLLNANHAAPGPTQFFEARLVEPARAGQRRVQLDPALAKTARRGRTGLNEGDKAAGILFTRIDAGGTAELSKPLPSSLPAGPQKAATLGFPPFQRPKTTDGAPNRAFEATMEGWLKYVGAVTGETKRALGSDAFDVEVWNELSFGADFLDAGTYYEDPPPGSGDTTAEILRRTVSWLRDPRNGVAGARVGNGFANQTPFAAGSTSPRGLSAIDKHPYPRLRQFPEPQQDALQPLDARGEPDRSPFTPRYRSFFPEYYLSAIQTEHLVRDLSPIETQVGGVPHGRSTAPDGSPPPEMWITELNLDLSGGDPTKPASPNPGSAPASGPNAARVQAKGVLRSLSAYVNKGVSAIDFYAVRDPGFALVPPGFFQAAAARGGRYPGFGSAGITLTALRRYLAAFDGPAEIDDRRRLELLAVGEDHGHRQFDGDGSPEHPPLYNRDVLAFLPFQKTDDRFVVPVYVMTRDLAKQLSPERYRLEIKGLEAEKAKATATDPLTGRSSPVRVLSRSGDRVVVELEATDSPRLLELEG